MEKGERNTGIKNCVQPPYKCNDFKMNKWKIANEIIKSNKNEEWIGTYANARNETLPFSNLLRGLIYARLQADDQLSQL